MDRLKDLISDLGYPLAARVIDERIAGFFVTQEAPPQWYGHPPALLPLLSDGSLPSYVGVWKHWFVQREASFVNLSVSDGHRVDEVARTEEQLAQWLVARLIVAFDDVSDDVHALAEMLEVRDLDAIDAVTQDTGDDPMGLAVLPAFATRLPLESCDPVVYDGDFVRVPDWLDPSSNKPDLFRTYLEGGDLGSAWLTLNGTGWSFAAAAHALGQLAATPGVEADFQRMAEIWIASAAGDPGGY